MPFVFTTPTKQAEWVTVGDRCQSPAGMLGTVLRVTPSSVPFATVRWDNGVTGRMTITLLRRVEGR